MAEITYKLMPKTVQDLTNAYQKRQLNLSPAFQRGSVWTTRDRSRLIDSMLRRWPLPAIFLYRRQVDGDIVWDVIDGKQRLETILRFVGVLRGEHLRAKFQLTEDRPPEWVDWKMLRRRRQQHLVTGYSLTTIEVDGGLAEIIDLFVRINSTGKALSAAEKRNARFRDNPLLREARRVASRWDEYLRQQKIVSAAQIGRMKDIELLCELMVSVDQGDVINKKAVLDRVMGAGGVTPARAAIAGRKLGRTLSLVRRMFPKLPQTRFSRVSDFYTLVVLIAKFDAEGLVLTDRRQNQLAWDLLVSLSTGVDEVRVRQKELLTQRHDSQLYREYLLTVLEGTDEISQRRRREDILRGLLGSLFAKKDTDRLFSPEQRRVMWNASSDRRCAVCHRLVTWADLTIDHVRPHTKGGRTELANAALAHRACNARKGAR